MKRTIDHVKLLAAPCVWCHYDGMGYYQASHHHDTCPFFNMNYTQRVEYVDQCRDDMFPEEAYRRGAVVLEGDTVLVRCDVRVGGLVCAMERGHDGRHKTLGGNEFGLRVCDAKHFDPDLGFNLVCILVHGHDGDHRTFNGYAWPGDAVLKTNKRRANDTQVGGTHYNKYRDFQPWDAWHLWGLNAFQGAIIKYVVRYRDKNKIEDLKKARHYLDKLIELEEGEHDKKGIHGGKMAGAVSPRD